ncbi:hypothetical protein ACTXT7_011059 [Hymenolepis weldensis]
MAVLKRYVLDWLFIVWFITAGRLFYGQCNVKFDLNALVNKVIIFTGVGQPGAVINNGVCVIDYGQNTRGKPCQDLHTAHVFDIFTKHHKSKVSKSVNE